MSSRKRNVAAVFIFSAFALSATFFLCNAHPACVNAQDKGNDGPPVVKISAPKNNSSYSWNSLVNYSIVVTYQGKSTQYQEIPSSQVLLKTTYVRDSSAAAANPASANAVTAAGLLDIINSTCLGCHQFKAKSMGPSFAAIGGRYPNSQSTADSLIQHIRAGCTGVWGQAAMPAQTQLSEDKLQAIVHWIMNDAANPNVNYYVGTEGSFRMDAVGTPDSKAGLILSANYTSPIPNDTPEQAPHGEDTVIVGGK